MPEDSEETSTDYHNNQSNDIPAKPIAMSIHFQNNREQDRMEVRVMNLTDYHSTQDSDKMEEEANMSTVVDCRTV